MFDYVYKQRRSYFGYFGGGFDHGYKQQRTPLVAGIDNVYNPLRRLAGFGFGLAAPISSSAHIGGAAHQERILDHYAPPVVTPRRQSCASEQIVAALYC